MALVKPTFDTGADTEQYARELDAQDHLRSFREKFIIPSKANLKTKKLEKPGLSPHLVDPLLNAVLTFC
jgi:kynureninase